MAATVLASPSPARARAFDFDYRSPARVEGSPLPCRTGCTDKLEEVCATSQMRVKQWRKERSQAMSAIAQRGLQEILKEEDVLEDLQADLATVEELTEAARGFREEGAQLGEAVLQCMKSAGDRAEVVTKAKEILRSAKADYQKELEAEEQRFAEQKEASRLQHLKIEAFLQRYSCCLGLEITRVCAQTIRLCFTLIDKADTSREFTLVLGLSKEGYVASNCNPEVPELPELLERLNEDSTNVAAVPRFVCGLRRAFARIAA
ncbi:unnamed protein product [Durusdinium trenchii]|uniref:Kinetochore protein SPC25 n=2 Tax=Durusdinium trenchii TaxID=1381693 RepID=A0ABP0HHB0_9DINO